MIFDETMSLSKINIPDIESSLQR